jgi:hypothetical protein
MIWTTCSFILGDVVSPPLGCCLDNSSFSHLLPSWLLSRQYSDIMLQNVDYSLTRTFSVRHRFITPRCYCLAIVLLFSGFAVLIIPVIVIAVGYESDPVLQVSYNATAMRWYDHLKFPKLVTTTQCQGSVMKVNEGNASASRLIIDISSRNSF